MQWEAYFRQEEDAALGNAMAECVNALLADWAVESLAALDRALYKFTEAGVSLGVRLHSGGYAWSGSKEMREAEVGNVAALGVGSIVEGSEACVSHRFLELLEFAERDPQEFVDAFGSLVDAVDAEACALWDEVHAEE